jgi:hypothetical protein
VVKLQFHNDFMILYLQKYTKECANNIIFHGELRYKFAAVSKFTGHSTTKCLLTLKTHLCFLKSEGPLNLKKCSWEQEETVSCRLIPLLSHVSFRCTVPLIDHFLLLLVFVKKIVMHYLSQNFSITIN